MTNRKAVKAVNRTLQDIRQNHRLMGGTTVLFWGDFRQTVPIAPRGTRADEIAAYLKSSVLWRNISFTHQSVNIRAQLGGCENAQYYIITNI